MHTRTITRDVARDIGVIVDGDLAVLTTGRPVLRS
ncbi:hypothetical protein C8E97_3079 [Saccharothrix australiensis]|uniref:Uncharacterized protein n=1 Tax=Saccharothrix australiensis TaxID=2072 RepID=A0A495W0D0_9PSEU|nr:hypothetical protein C8E97_3079 [Saccharothrix australiensis]